MTFRVELPNFFKSAQAGGLHQVLSIGVIAGECEAITPQPGVDCFYRLTHGSVIKKFSLHMNKIVSARVTLIAEPAGYGETYFGEMDMSRFIGFLATIIIILMTAPAFAGGHITWNLVSEESRLAFGSIKKDTVGEVHHFNKLTGLVKENGDMTLSIDLASVETNIDIRNERMARHVFQEGKATAVLTGKIDMSEVNELKVGQTKIVEIEAQLVFAGVENDIEAEMLVVRLSEDRVLVTTADFIMLSSEDLEIDGGIDMLQKLAKLSGITRSIPVSVRAVFQK